MRMGSDYSGDMSLEVESFLLHDSQIPVTTVRYLWQGNASWACLVNYLAADPRAWPNASNCSLLPLPDLHLAGSAEATSMTLVAGRVFYAWFTPLVLVVGLAGNSLSLCVFLSRNMRCLSASTYLAALSTADLVALVCYVLVEWLIRGLPVLRQGLGVESGEGAPLRAGFMAAHGSCQMVMYLHYVSRFLSAWLVVAFTVERYIGVCHPLRRRDICTTSCTRRAVLGLVLLSFLLNVFKPLLSQVQDIPGWGRMCTSHEGYRGLSFVLDSLYAVLITFLPFVVISIFNLLIVRKLLRHKRARRQMRLVTEESVIRLEFTLILLAVSFCFVALNVPYFAVWLQLFLASSYVQGVHMPRSADLDYFRGVVFITRAIFYVNYCINFFLYSVTGAYFRQELRMLFVLRQRSYKFGSGYRRCSHFRSSNRSNASSSDPCRSLGPRGSRPSFTYYCPVCALQIRSSADRGWSPTSSGNSGSGRAHRGGGYGEGSADHGQAGRLSLARSDSGLSAAEWLRTETACEEHRASEGPSGIRSTHRAVYHSDSDSGLVAGSRACRLQRQLSDVSATSRQLLLGDQDRDILQGRGSDPSVHQLPSASGHADSALTLRSRLPCQTSENSPLSGQPLLEEDESTGERKGGFWKVLQEAVVRKAELEKVRLVKDHNRDTWCHKDLCGEVGTRCHACSTTRPARGLHCREMVVLAEQSHLNGPAEDLIGDSGGSGERACDSTEICSCDLVMSGKEKVKVEQGQFRGLSTLKQQPARGSVQETLSPATAQCKEISTGAQTHFPRTQVYTSPQLQEAVVIAKSLCQGPVLSLPTRRQGTHSYSSKAADENRSVEHVTCVQSAPVLLCPVSLP